jgi:hypothetical protein
MGTQQMRSSEQAAVYRLLFPFYEPERVPGNGLFEKPFTQWCMGKSKKELKFQVFFAFV